MTVEDVLKDLEENNDGSGDDSGSSSDDSGNDSGDADKGKDTDKGDGTDSGDDGSDGAGDDGDTGKKSDSDDDDTDDPIEQLKQTQDELRQMLRISRRENAAMKAKLDRFTNKQQKNKNSDEFDDDDSDDDSDKGDGGELSRIEQLQQQLQQIHDVKGASFELLAEQMAETQKYADVAEVCSRQNMDDILEAAATALHEQTGADFNELILELETNIWNRPNPYKYLYSLVKEHHPKYQKADATKDTDKDDDVTGKKSASSIQDMGGAGTKGGGGWTAEKIDAMPEDELHKVPEDVYDKYLAGELD